MGMVWGMDEGNARLPDVGLANRLCIGVTFYPPDRMGSNKGEVGVWVEWDPGRLCQ